jgi:tRNA threonylcarbamoyl adenosine modification protein (Sua5/YciO/YrdC/YwlC family)
VGQFFHIHPTNPQPRLIAQAAAIVRADGVIVYPTDSCYAIGCHMGNKGGMERIRRLRNLDAQKYFTLICHDLAEVSSYARLENTAFRLLKSVTPGPYTFVLKATREVPRRLQDPRRKTIGLRVPDNGIVQALLQSLGEPLMSTTLLLPGSQLPMTDPEEIYARLKLVVDLVIDGGTGGLESTTVIDLTDAQMPRLLRKGLGDASVVVES